MTKITSAWIAAVTALFAALSPAPRDARADDDEEPASCLSCHAQGATKKGAPEGFRVDPKAFLEAVHKKSCLQCHEDMEDVPHKKKKADAVNCSTCHDKAVDKFKATPHGKLASEGNKSGPTCSSCHPPHATFDAKDARSSLFKRNLPATCGQCHDGAQTDGAARIPKTVADYAKSVHGIEVIEKGNLKAAGCTDCHPVHDMRPGSDPASRTFKPNVPKLCGTCHEKIAAQYAQSVHGTALAHGKMEAAACTDCHSEHSIARPDAVGSTVGKAHVSQTCANCHAAERIVRKYGLPADRVATYQDSYHGLADKNGSSAAANCSSCHGFHDVLPSSDPKSRINKANLLATCSRCHEGATQGFIEGRVHAAPDPEKERAAYWVQLVYWFLIPLTIGGMLLHNGVIFGKYLRDKMRARRAAATYARFSRFEVASHAALAGSFIALAVTGFALTYPTAAWARGLAAIGMSETVRALIHRVAAAAFAATALAHVAYSASTKHGRYGLAQFVPRAQDAKDALGNMKWHLGLSKEKPRFDRFDYTMKVEYWALVWGGFVMLATGSMLWFKVDVTHWMPRWLVYVAERIHFYEAILAVSAIVVWHFFFVIFHPAEYPMSLTWLDGRVTKHEMEEAHPVELERIEKSAGRGTGQIVTAAGDAPDDGRSRDPHHVRPRRGHGSWRPRFRRRASPNCGGAAGDGGRAEGRGVDRNWRLALAGTALAPLLAVSASADDGAPAPPPGDLLSEIDRFVGEPIHGDLTTKYRARWTKAETDQDLYEYLSLRVGDENTDRVSGSLFARVAGDLDAGHSQDRGGHVFNSLNDTSDSRVNALLYTAYATIRPAQGPLELARVGRQYVFAAETFQIDGACVTTRPLVDSVKLQITGYSGVPVHLYEASPSGDWLAGLRVAAAPWTGGRVAAEYTHDQDRLSVLSQGTAVNDLAALSVWQTAVKHVDVYGQFTWLDGPRDGTLRATWAVPDQDLLVQASYYRLLETKKQFATEFDPYYSVVNELVRYQQAEVHASKGFGEHYDVEVGGSVRHLLAGEHEAQFNRDTSRVYVTPSVTDLPWKGSSASVTGESLHGDGGRITTWAADLSQKFGKKTKVSVGSDYSLYAFGPLGAGERSRVRTAYVRVKTQLTKSLSADVQYTWENDDVESFHVLSAALVLTF